MPKKKPNTRFTRIGTGVLQQLRAFCRKTKGVQSDVVSDAVTLYLKRAGKGLRTPARPKTSTPNPRRK